MTNETITTESYNEVDQLPVKPSVFAGRTAIWIGASVSVMILGLCMIPYAMSSYSSEPYTKMWVIVAGVAAIAMLSAYWYQFKTLRNALGTLGHEGRGLAEKMNTIIIMGLTAMAVTMLVVAVEPSKGSTIAIPAFAGIYFGWLIYNLGSSISEEFGGRLGKLGKLIEYAGIINILSAIISPFKSFAESESQAEIFMIFSGLVMIAGFAVGIRASMVFDRLFVAYYPTAADGQPAGAMQTAQPGVEQPVTEPPALTAEKPAVEKPAEPALSPAVRPVAKGKPTKKPQKNQSKMWILIAGLLVLGTAAGWFVSRQSDSTDEDARMELIGTGIDEEEFEEEEVAVAVAGNYKMTGTIDAKWPATMWLTVDEDGNAKGRYCYDRTIDKYGDKAENYFYLKGHRDIDGELYLTSSKWNESEYFERFTLKINGSVASGNLKNIDSDNIHSVMFDNVIKAQL